MEKILVLSGSNSIHSINSQLLDFFVASINGYNVQRQSLLSYDIPMYNLDLENERGIPIDVKVVKNKIAESVGLIIGVNEHNGMISAFFKNIIDWLSRADRNFLEGKKILLVSTSPGARGGASAVEYMKNTIPRFGGKVVESFSFPSFQENFNVEQNTIINPTMNIGVGEVIASFIHQLED
ncbi:NADPH-dependent FMN reductase [Dokdonia sp. Hel_I_53]|uniref:NADPH-dependent FMN reductase n=1 Tax=Dokdonia sp. Hel_I_53 TaxID=1566287 RepID=UPI00119A9015|nr:NAD(P)H-dependent oxidoreductase [Dokdonia sp. Hel_I_53]TVZ51813.1 NAD(P)H-dependent FMN reductase [Dokdonia sp. Hel_I_53]